MRCLLVVAALALAASPVAARPRVRMDRLMEPLRLVFLDADERAPVRQAFAGDAAIDVGRVTGTSTKCTPRSCIVQRRFRLRVEGRSSARFAAVRAYLAEDLPGQRVRIDGRLLSTAMTLVDAAAPIGVATTHVLEIEISSTEPDGLLAHTIEWTAEDLP
jgi:hypothetical protein